MFSCEFCEISWNTFFHRTPLVAASEKSKVQKELSETEKHLRQSLQKLKKSYFTNLNEKCVTDYQKVLERQETFFSDDVNGKPISLVQKKKVSMLFVNFPVNIWQILCDN